MIKRTFDILFSVFGIALCFPLLLGIALAIWLDDGLPIFYRGERVGLGGRMFRIFKFRTMFVNAESLGPSSTSSDDDRIIRSGKFVRKYKLDELPQFFNVLIGDMSFVGPRPQVKWAVDLYTERERVLLSVRPGITDRASIYFRNEAEILAGSEDPDADYLQKIAPEKIRMGLAYVQDHSLRTDVFIIMATVWTVFGGDPQAILARLDSKRASALHRGTGSLLD